MTHFLRRLAAAAACSMALGAQATTSLQLGGYTLAGSYTIDALGGFGLEASAVTYARDRGTLFVVGDEGLGVLEISRVGNVVSTMAFDWAGTGSTHNDAEGLTYLGAGRLVVVDERPQMAYRFDYAAGTTLALNAQPKVAITGSATSVGNVGTEGISFDPRDGRFFSVKQDNPAELRVSTLNFAVGGGTATTTTLFSGATSLFGVNSLSDVQTLAAVDALAGTVAADHLLVLSLDSRRLLEIDRFGSTVSSLDLSGLTAQAIEGVTIDELGTIYLVAEDSGTGNSRLLVLTPVPEPQTYALMLSGLLALGWMRRKRR
jgi:hypothetical protein